MRGDTSGFRKVIKHQLWDCWTEKRTTLSFHYVWFINYKLSFGMHARNVDWLKLLTEAGYWKKTSRFAFISCRLFLNKAINLVKGTTSRIYWSGDSYRRLKKDNCFIAGGSCIFSTHVHHGERVNCLLPALYIFCSVEEQEDEQLWMFLITFHVALKLQILFMYTCFTTLQLVTKKFPFIVMLPL